MEFLTAYGAESPKPIELKIGMLDDVKHTRSHTPKMIHSALGVLVGRGKIVTSRTF